MGSTTQTVCASLGSFRTRLAQRTDYLRFLAWDRRQSVLGYPFQRERFRSIHGKELDITKPRTWNAKIVRKKLFDRSPLLVATSDKLAVREYIRHKLGDGPGKALLIPLIQTVDCSTRLSPSQWPIEVVMKPNHASGRVLLAPALAELTKTQLRRRARQWLDSPFGIRGQQWAYQRIKRQIVVEQWLRDSELDVPPDYNLFMIRGHCEYIRVIYGRRRTRMHAHFHGDWSPMKVASPRTPLLPAFEPPPAKDYMIELAHMLSADFDAVRVDLYCFDGHVYFGELTHYPGSGFWRLEPDGLDEHLGALWGEQDY